MSAESVTYSYATLGPGDPIAPLLKDLQAFQTRIDPYAGRPFLLCLLPSINASEGRDALDQLAAEPGLETELAARILVTADDAQKEVTGALAVFNERIVDRGFQILRALGAAPQDASWNGDPGDVRTGWVIVDPSLHVLRTGFFLTPAKGSSSLADALEQLPTLLAPYGVARFPPVLMLPNAFSPGLCQALVAAYDRNGGTETGVVVNNETVLAPDIKRRRDYVIEEPELIRATHQSLARHITPEIERLFFLKMNRVTRNMVACYAAAEGGHFLRPHRDNVSAVTAHRRFAVSVNLVDSFEGGEVVFPEYGDARYRAPPGWALVFPCNIVHLVTRVEAGARYVWLPFLHE